MAGLRIGLVYDLLGSYPRQPGDPPDADAEFEPEETIRVLESAIERLGHRGVRLGNPHALLDQIGRRALPRVNVALNIAEGHGGRNREAWAPVLLEMARVPTLGSDALSLSLSLDKYWASQRVAGAGVRIPGQAVAGSAEEAEKIHLPGPFPLFVKPRWEGTSKGIRPRSRVADRGSLAVEVERIARDYRGPALIEEFLEGPEYTVTIVGNDPPRALAVLQRAIEVSTRIGLHAVETHAPPEGGWHFCVPGSLEPDLEQTLAELALTAYRALACLDFARVDLRLDAAGRPHFLEINPLPTFAPDGSFGILAELAGRDLSDLLAEVLGEGLRRLGLG